MSKVEPDDLVSVISEVFAPAQVSPDGTFEELGVTSVVRLRLLVSIQQRLGVNLDVVDIFSVHDVRGLIRLVEEHLPEEGFAPT